MNTYNEEDERKKDELRCNTLVLDIIREDKLTELKKLKSTLQRLLDEITYMSRDFNQVAMAKLQRRYTRRDKLSRQILNLMQEI